MFNCSGHVRYYSRYVRDCFFFVLEPPGGKGGSRPAERGLLLLALPVLLPAALVKSLPHYLKKEGLWYRWRWVVYFNVTAWLLLLILVCLPE